MNPSQSRISRFLHFSFCAALIASATALPAQTPPPGPANPIILGDHPDPSIIRVGKTYWVASTSGDWAPEFPLYRSTDLKIWKAAGSIFPQTPKWATGSFWAPELVYDRSRVLVFYVARKREGPLCVALATAAQPEGPYEDHGPIVCQTDGSIDPAFVRDEHGVPYLIWKEDGNSIGQHTPIWAQPLTSDLMQLTGTKTQLITNESASWEGGVVEAPYIMRHGGQFYMFYAGNACCGTECHYAEGVARAPNLLGPWEKDAANPIILPNGTWKCPGHGTAVETPKGETYFVYHAYPAAGTIYLGRESLLDRVDWGADGWPAINGGRGPSGTATTTSSGLRSDFVDNFREAQLDAGWRWPIGHDPIFHVGHGQLALESGTGGKAVFLARALSAQKFVSTVGLLSSDASGALAVIGDARKKLTLARTGSKLTLSRDDGKNTEVLWSGDVGSVPTVWARAESQGKPDVSFSYSIDRVHWTKLNGSLSIAQLPVWDQGLRVGLMVQGAPGTHAAFSSFSLRTESVSP